MVMGLMMSEGVDAAGQGGMMVVRDGFHPKGGARNALRRRSERVEGVEYGVVGGEGGHALVDSIRPSSSVDSSLIGTPTTNEGHLDSTTTRTISLTTHLVHRPHHRLDSLDDGASTSNDDGYEDKEAERVEGERREGMRRTVRVETEVSITERDREIGDGEVRRQT